MVHREFNKVDHSHEGDVVGRSIHEADHVHLHVHVRRADGEVVSNRGVRDCAGAVEVFVHLHVAVTIGGHEFSLLMKVISHHSDRGEVVKMAFCGSADCSGDDSGNDIFHFRS